MKRSLLSELIVALLILLVVYTATSKFLEFSSFRHVLFVSLLIGQTAELGSWLTRISEYMVADPLFFPITCYWSIGALLILVPAAHIAYMPALAFYHPRSGGCVIRPMRSKQHLAINSFYTLVALVGIWLYRKSCSSIQQAAFPGSIWPGFNL